MNCTGDISLGEIDGSHEVAPSTHWLLDISNKVGYCLLPTVTCCGPLVMSLLEVETFDVIEHSLSQNAIGSEIGYVTG